MKFIMLKRVLRSISILLLRGNSVPSVTYGMGNNLFFKDHSLIKEQWKNVHKHFNYDRY
jgi:hypothetical protein